MNDLPRFSVRMDALMAKAIYRMGRRIWKLKLIPWRREQNLRRVANVCGKGGSGSSVHARNKVWYMM